MLGFFRCYFLKIHSGLVTKGTVLNSFPLLRPPSTSINQRKRMDHVQTRMDVIELLAACFYFPWCPLSIYTSRNVLLALIAVTSLLLEHNTASSCGDAWNFFL